MILIHIGLPKSGSASIQSFLSANETALRALSVDYPSIGRKERKDHHNFSSELKNHKNFDRSFGTLEELYDYWLSEPSTIKIISSEKFEKLSVSEIQVLHRNLRMRNNSFRIVMIIRDIIDLLPSSYIQKVRYGLKIYSFDFFFENRLQESRTNYFHTAEKWASVFGWNRLRVRLLDPVHMVNRDLIDDFLATAGVDPMTPEYRALTRLERMNESSGWRIVEAIRALYSGRHELPDHHPLVEFLKNSKRLWDRKLIEASAVSVARELEWPNEKGLYLKRSQAEEALGVYRELVEAMNAHLIEKIPLPLDLDARGFVERPFLPTIGRLPPARLRSFYDRLGEVVNAPMEPLTQSQKSWQPG